VRKALGPFFFSFPDSKFALFWDMTS
jgi:hypothetical protein